MCLCIWMVYSRVTTLISAPWILRSRFCFAICFEEEKVVEEITCMFQCICKDLNYRKIIRINQSMFVFVGHSGIVITRLAKLAIAFFVMAKVNATKVA